jgi:hypothetical protein
VVYHAKNALGGLKPALSMKGFLKSTKKPLLWRFISSFLF